MKHYFAEFPVLAGDGLRLRRVMPADIADVLEISMYEGEVASNAEEALAILERIEGNYADGDGVHWGICDGDGDEVLGTIGFYRGFPDNVGEVGYVLRPGYRGTGLMTRAVRLVIGFGFRTLGLDMIIGIVKPGNDASVGVLERAGFVRAPDRDGLLRFELRKPVLG